MFRLASSFILLPFLLSLLDDDSLGLWYVFLSVNSFVVLFQAGFAPTFARNIAYCWSGARSLTVEGVDRTGFQDQRIDFSLFANVVYASKILYGIIAVVVLIGLLTGGTAYILSITGRIPLGVSLPAWAVFCAGVFLNMFFSYYESLLRGVADFPDINKSTIASSSFQIIVSALLLMSGFGILSCALAFCVQGVLFRTLCRRAFLRYQGIGANLQKERGETSFSKAWSIVKVVAPNAVRDTIVSFSNYAVTTANTIISSLFISLSLTGSYSILLQLVNAAGNLANVAITTNQPALQSAYARGDTDLERELTGKTAIGFIGIYTACSIGIIFVLVPLIGLFKPKFQYDLLLLLLMILYIFLWKQHSMCATFLTNTNRLPFVKAFVVSSAAGCLLTVALLQMTDLGVYALVLGQLLAQLAYNNWKWPMTAARRLGATYMSLLIEGVHSYISDFKSRS